MTSKEQQAAPTDGLRMAKAIFAALDTNEREKIAREVAQYGK